MKNKKNSFRLHVWFDTQKNEYSFGAFYNSSEVAQSMAQMGRDGYDEMVRRKQTAYRHGDQLSGVPAGNVRPATSLLEVHGPALLH